MLSSTHRRRLLFHVAAWASLAAEAAAQSIALTTPTRTLDPAGGQLTLSVDVGYSGNLGYEVAVTIPRGWEYLSGTTEPVGHPFVGAQVKLLWFDHNEARGPGRFSFTLQYPAGVSSASIVPALTLTRDPPYIRMVGGGLPPYDIVSQHEGSPVNFGPPIAPRIIYPPINRLAAVDGPAWFTVSAEGTAPLRYQWRKGGAPIPGATAASYSIASSRLNDAGNYDVLVSNATGSAISRAAALTVKVFNPLQSAPVIDAGPFDTTTLAGGATVFGVVVLTNYAASFQWARNGTAIAGATDQVLVLPNTQPADAGTYAVTVRHDFGSAVSGPAVLTVGPPPSATEPPRIVTQPLDVASVISEPGELSVVAAGSPPLRYQWSVNGQEIPAATGAALDLATVTGTPHGGSYRVVVSNALGAVTSRVATVRLQPVDLAPSTIPSSETQRTIEGATVVFNAPATATPPFSYHWFKGDTPIPGATNASLAVGPVIASDAGRYRAVIGSLLGSTQHFVDLVIESAPTPPSIRFISTTVALENPTTLTAQLDGSSPFRVQWLKDGVEISGATSAQLTIPAVQFGDVGGYAVRATNVAGTTTSDEVRLDLGNALTSFVGRGPTGAPAILAPPVDQTVAATLDAAFRIETQTAFAPVRYQWRKDGVAIPGATFSELALAGVSGRDAGWYSVIAWTSRGATVSPAARLAISAADVPPARSDGRQRLGNLSSRALATADARTMIAGFVIDGTEPMSVLLRAVGPTLAQFGVTGPIATPQLEVMHEGTVILRNTNWSTASDASTIPSTAQRVGAFALPSGSRDAALVAWLAPGAYTVTATGGTGITLLETYDASDSSNPTGPRLVNLSTRAFAGSGSEALVAGFVVIGPAPKRMLLRGVGPALERFGVANPLADPVVRVFAGSIERATNDNWSDRLDAGDVATNAARVRAFPLAPGSKDAALLIELAPGAYTAHVSSKAGVTGVALAEIYELP